MSALLPAPPWLYLWLAGIALFGVAVRIVWWWRIEGRRRCVHCGLEKGKDWWGWSAHEELCFTKTHPRRMRGREQPGR